MDSADVKAKPRRRTRRKAEEPAAPIEPSLTAVEAVALPAVATGRQRVLAVLGPKGGIGKTSLARNMAVAAAMSGLKVGVADLDAQKTLMKWFSRRPEGATPIAFWAAEMTDTAELLKTIEGFDLLIVDTPPGIEAYPEDVKRLIAAADFILIPCGPSNEETESVIPWMEFVRQFGKSAAFVLNRAAKNTVSNKEAKLELNRAGYLCPVDIPASEDIKRSSKLGIGVLEIRGGFGADEVNGVWEFTRRELGIKG